MGARIWSRTNTTPEKSNGLIRLSPCWTLLTTMPIAMANTAGRTPLSPTSSHQTAARPGLAFSRTEKNFHSLRSCRRCIIRECTGTMADASGAGGIIPATATAVKRFGMGQWGAFLFLFPPCCSWVRLSATRVAIKKAPTVSAFGVFPSLRGDSYLNKPPLRFGDDDEYRRVFEKVR